MSLGSIFTSAILPVVGIARIGDALGRTSDVAVDSLNTVGGVTVSEFASTVVTVTTLVSVPTMTLLISLLQSSRV